MRTRGPRGRQGGAGKDRGELENRGEA